MASATGAAIAALPVAAPPSFVLRIGIEHLPPDARPVEEGPRLEALPRVARPRPGRAVETRRRSELDLMREQVEATDDPLAREALHFMSDMVDADRQRASTEVGIPFFDFRRFDEDRGPLLASELALQADQEEWLQVHGTALLRRPLRRMLRRLPFVRAIELEFESFRSDHVPLSEPYVQAHGNRMGLGRVSVRLRANNLDDPVEIVWVHNYTGLRIGTTQETGRISLGLQLASRLQLDLRARTDYETDEYGVRADLSYRPSPSTSLHVAIGDDMDFLSTASMYSLFESPMDGSPGLVLYAVHVF